MSFGHFAANFANGLAQGKILKQKQEEEKKERDAKLKLFEIQLAREQRAMQQDLQQQDARKQLLGKMNGAETLPGTGVQLMDPTKKGMSLTELLADPESAMMLLQSGLVKGDDILKQQESSANREMMQRLIMGGGIGGGIKPGDKQSEMELQGIKIGGAGQIMPDFGLPQVTSPQTINTPEGPRLQTFNPRTGRMVADLGQPKPDNVAPEVAGRISGLVQAQEIAGQIKGQFVNPDGSVNRKLIIASFGNLPGTQGRQIRNDVGIAVDAVLRARTGAGVNTAEQKQVVEQFLPSPLDDDATVISKLQRLDQFVSGTLDIATLPPEVRKRLEKDQAGKVVDFNSLPK